MRATSIKVKPNKNMVHLSTFFVPLSLEILNKSKSEEPTNAPEKPFDSGDIIKDTIIKIADIANIIQINTDKIPPTLLN